MSQALKNWAYEQNPSLLDDNLSVDPDYQRWADSVQTTIEEKDQYMKMNEMYKSASDFLKAADLNGKAKRLKMADIRMETFNSSDGEQTKPVLSFSGTDRELVLNKTNGQAIATMYGDDSDDWMGKEVVIYPTMVDFGGNQVPAIRVQVQMPEAEAGFDDSLPF